MLHTAPAPGCHRVNGADGSESVAPRLPIERCHQRRKRQPRRLHLVTLRFEALARPAEHCERTLHGAAIVETSQCDSSRDRSHAHATLGRRRRGRGESTIAHRQPNVGWKARKRAANRSDTDPGEKAAA